MAGSVLDKVIWKGNSKKMYKYIFDAVPSLFKSMVKNEVENWLVKNNVQTVTEDMVIKMFQEKAPKGMMQKLTPQLEKMKTE